MEYMLFIATDTEPGDPGATEAVDRRLGGRGRPPGHAQSARRRPAGPQGHDIIVHVHGGQVLVADGPFTESKEWIVGYDLLECEDLDQAIDYVSRHPMAHHGRIEIRPVEVFDE